MGQKTKKSTKHPHASRSRARRSSAVAPSDASLDRDVSPVEHGEDAIPNDAADGWSRASHGLDGGRATSHEGHHEHGAPSDDTTRGRSPVH